MRSLQSILKDNEGATMVEFTIVMMLLFLLTLGMVDVGNMFFQWNSAEKATQVGVRSAAISDPVAPELATFRLQHRLDQPRHAVPRRERRHLRHDRLQRRFVEL